MSNKSFKFLSLSILALFFLVSVVSASTVLTIESTTTFPQSVNHGEEITIDLTVTYTGDSEDGVEIEWSGEEPGDETFWVLPEMTQFDKDVPPTSTSFKFKIPQNYASGTIEAKLRATGAGQEPDDFDFIINVPQSPSLSIEKVLDLTKTQSGKIKITNTGNVDLENIKLKEVSGSNDFSITLPQESFSLAPGEPKEIDIISADVENLDFSDDNIITIKAENENVSSDPLKIEVPVKFCGDCENEGDLNIKDMTFSVETGFGEDDNFWYPFDEIEVEVEVENKGNWKIDNIEIETCLLDKEEGTCVIDERDMSISKKKFNLDEKGRDDEISVLINFEVNAKDLEVKSNNYEFYVKATGKIDDKDAPEELDGEKTCASDSKEIDIRTDDNFVILNNFEFLETVQCGSEVQITFDAWNIADKKIDSKEIYIHVYNNDLKIDEVIDVDDIRALDNEKVEFTLNIPSQIEGGWYPIEFNAYDNEDCSDGDIYENSEEDKASYKIYIKVEGNCIVEAEIDVVATVKSGGNAGQKLVVNTFITNLLNELVGYDLSLAGYDSWASSASLDQSNILLEAGESKEVAITFDVKSDSGGKESSFDIIFSGQDIVSSEKHIEGIIIAEQKGFLAGITGNIIGEGNWYLWGIGALNVLLVLIIVVVAFRVAKKN